MVAAADMGSTPLTNGPFDNTQQDQKAEIVVGSGAGIATTVKVFDVSGMLTPTPSATAAAAGSFTPFSTTLTSFQGGVSLSVARINADLIPDIVVGAGVNGGSLVDVWAWNNTSSATLSSLSANGIGFAAFTGASQTAPVQVAALDTNGDDMADVILAVQGPGGTTGQIRAFDITSVSPLQVSPPTAVPGSFLAPYFIATIKNPSPIPSLVAKSVSPVETLTLYDPYTSTFSLRYANTTGLADYTFAYGEANAGWQTLVGDWNGDRTTGVGLYDPATSTFYLTNAFESDHAQYTFGYGEPGKGWIPLVGDWDGNGTSGVGLYDPHTSTFYLTNTLQTGIGEYTFGYGEPNAGWTPLVGDWNGDGRTGVGLYNPHASTFYLTNTLQTGYAEHTFGYGEPNAGWQPLVGDWNGNGAAGVGLYDPSSSTFYLTDTLSSGYAEYTVDFGTPNAGWQPLVGYWGAASSATSLAAQSAGLAAQSLATTTTTPAAEAVDQIGLVDIARESACSTTLTDLDIPLVNTPSAKAVSEQATDLALQGL